MFTFGADTTGGFGGGGGGNNAFSFGAAPLGGAAAGGWGAAAPAAPVAVAPGGWGAPTAAVTPGWGAPAAAVAPTTLVNAFDRREQMSPAQRVQWIAHMQSTTQAMGAQLEAVRKAQEKRFQDVTASLEDVKKAQENLQSTFEVAVLNKLPGAKLAHLKLSHRLVAVMKQVELLRLRSQSTSSLDEEIWRSKLQSIKKELDRPDQFSGRLKEVSSRVKLAQDNGGGGGGGTADYEAADAESLEAMCGFLEEQREGIEKLLLVLSQDLQDVRLIETTLAQQSE